MQEEGNNREATKEIEMIQGVKTKMKRLFNKLLEKLKPRNHEGLILFSKC